MPAKNTKQNKDKAKIRITPDTTKRSTRRSPSSLSDFELHSLLGEGGSQDLDELHQNILGASTDHPTDITTHQDKNTINSLVNNLTQQVSEQDTMANPDVDMEISNQPIEAAQNGGNGTLLEDPVYVAPTSRSKVVTVADDTDDLLNLNNYYHLTSLNKSTFAPSGSGLTWFNDSDLNGCTYNVPALHSGITKEQIVKLVKFCTTPFTDSAQCALVGDVLLEVAFSYAALDGSRAFGRPSHTEPFKVKAATPLLKDLISGLERAPIATTQDDSTTLQSVLRTYHSHQVGQVDDSWITELSADPNGQVIFAWWAASILRLSTKAVENYVKYHTVNKSNLSRFQDHMVSFKPSGQVTAPLFPTIPEETLKHIKASFGKSNGTVFFMLARACGVIHQQKESDVAGILRGTFMVTVLHMYLSAYTMIVKAAVSSRVNPMRLLHDLRTSAMSSEILRMHRFLYTYVGSEADHNKWPGKDKYPRTGSIYWPIARVLNVNSLNVMGRHHSPYLTYVGFTLYNQTCNEKDIIKTSDYTPPPLGPSAANLDVYVATWLSIYNKNDGLLAGRSEIMKDYDHEKALHTYKKTRRSVMFSEPVETSTPEDVSTFTLNM